MLAGVTRKTSGKASILGVDIDADPSGSKKLIGVVPQELSFDAWLKVGDTIDYQFGYYGQPVDVAWRNEVMERLSLADKMNDKPRALSGGMKRRYMIARAMIHKPKILILDEPTAGVDVELRHEMYALLRELNEKGTTIVLTSHYLEEVELLCQRVAIVHKGSLVALDNKHALKDRFKSTRIFSIALTEPLKVCPAVLERFKPECVDSELKLTFEENEYQAVLKAVSEANLSVANFRVIEPTLEDVFLSLTV
jgi:ABC-2 type transport system ATP-binding protein